MWDFLHQFMNVCLGNTREQRLSILIYHRVLASPDPMRPAIPCVRQFEWQMRVLRRHFTVLPLSQALRLLRDGQLPPQAASITFDDGYADNYTLALPVLQRYNLPATVFVASGFLDGGYMWNDMVLDAVAQYRERHLDLEEFGMPVYTLADTDSRRRVAWDILKRSKYLEPEQRNAISRYLSSLAASLDGNIMLTKQQLIDISRAGVEIGGHTVSHPILTSISSENARTEIQLGKAQLEEVIQKPLQLFAYPNGRRGTDFNDEHVAMVREAGFAGAVITNPGVSIKTTDLFQLPRFTPWDRSTGKFLLRMALNSRRVVGP